ncbi:MAG: glutamine synthetase III [Oscillospiraceae bacterium]|nr:glutamine synthetase III [Oscillospiraceae bacterium]MDY3065446.1 glutamine synthetase III [Oscillospiraceae bacterium]
MSFDFTQFGTMVFGDEEMKRRLPETVYASLKKSIDGGLPLDPAIADDVASAMMGWAIEKGATHYTHWFQPMNNITAGKHDSFLSLGKDGKTCLRFSGKELIKGEPDASSFPNGGLRNTFEARGYTTWDCTSPAFVRDGTLYIPTAFCSYTGEALDTKTPLLRSMSVISEQAMRLLRLFGNKTATRVTATVGAEQEYFLIDRALYEKRLDLKICGRTLYGAKPAKGQEMEDHYFGRIRLRVAAFMRELDEALWRLGVTAKTKHNEVAPAQHELAPIFDTVNIAGDHNQLTMEVMRVIAKKNGLACLLHEKPFAGVNGSGKHNNWSLSADDGTNLLDPGKNPYENMQFLVMLCAVIAAVDNHADLLRMSAAVPGNDYRLGASEAPPAIISVFLGEQLTSILSELADGHHPNRFARTELYTGVPTIPPLKRDDSDRNRTSPFAFTGNKFEFRMVGSSASIACANYVLNTIVAESLDEICTRLEGSKDFDSEVLSIIHDTMRLHGRVIFNGNNYTDEWVSRAESLGLPNLRDTVAAAGAIVSPQSMAVLQKYHILTPVECEARYEIMLENYEKIIIIEANTMLEMAHRELLPAVVRSAAEAAQSAAAFAAAGVRSTRVPELAQTLATAADRIANAADRLAETVENAPENLPMLERASYARDTIKPMMESLRAAVDEAETLVSKGNWPVPSYTDLLHRV